MASKSKIEKQKRIYALVEKHAEKRAELIAKGDYEGLAKLPRNSSRTRMRRLCQLTGRPRGNYRKFQISRIALRDMALDGLIPGMKKSSW
ncbi:MULTISPECIES: 30S ribosomal protein S14 [Gimesia]|jgi:small subunit ribosomal protein S14|uniref:Small ribosomal subunit protein uS14 n=2 Tax=Gimesia TaxID=1649453 RepID=A0A6I6ACN0_9PLAN|nr:MULTISPECIES: 30S ribosomal protein S14 [Gimesia]MBN71342.1 30S ribosomal protein S14 [Gimesia sp.]MCR9234045.1 30S ribosomal protein S14 [bacterium]QDT24656.1 Alternate 30S ribosomal protein S14 [Gimesia chilikensis]QDT88330.1 Alternate 30S ribosomal protein S14 [Gimesia chilikensis]QGQ23766.1 30S ribosomal protein S14 [Gimesia benthica]